MCRGKGGCDLEAIRVGPIRVARNGLGTVWVRCPLQAALRVQADGRLRVGWSSARVTLLDRRPLQCYRCLAAGHTRDRCPSGVDRTGNCFNCGKEGYSVADCREKPRCPVCAERGLEANHRAGSVGCSPCPPARIGGNGKAEGSGATQRAGSSEGGGEVAAAE